MLLSADKIKLKVLSYRSTSTIASIVYPFYMQIIKTLNTHRVEKKLFLLVYNFIINIIKI